MRPFLFFLSARWFHVWALNFKNSNCVPFPRPTFHSRKIKSFYFSWNQSSDKLYPFSLKGFIRSEKRMRSMICEQIIRNHRSTETQTLLVVDLTLINRQVMNKKKTKNGHSSTRDRSLSWPPRFFICVKMWSMFSGINGTRTHTQMEKICSECLFFWADEIDFRTGESRLAFFFPNWFVALQNQSEGENGPTHSSLNATRAKNKRRVTLRQETNEHQRVRRTTGESISSRRFCLWTRTKFFSSSADRIVFLFGTSVWQIGPAGTERAHPCRCPNWTLIGAKMTFFG